MLKSHQRFFYKYMYRLASIICLIKTRLKCCFNTNYDHTTFPVGSHPTLQDGGHPEVVHGKHEDDEVSLVDLLPLLLNVFRLRVIGHGMLRLVLIAEEVGVLKLSYNK